ncbi:outer membrane beta-barrel protein [Christiangramia flava]|uniref:Uncharacterized protein n=1 Tax=Christiangramia flava JLT2011 TaxID=1229726 RepID=A0A1L7I6B2_9FLAO|nr:outer membrane beta-barrel protein [Christiangramia flava]APU68642.1 hypothetical protein GRFL_1918 [Christiangramia flava JLT2011]OSS38166.1 hypothetical protein C723_2867 [Christiangramia flava JLT2011]
MKLLKPFQSILYFVFLLSFLFSVKGYGQEFDAGLKAGLNYSLDTEGAEVTGSLGNFTAQSMPGFYAGAFAEMRFEKIFLRPEILYNHVKGEFQFPNTTSVYTIDKVSIPLLVGYNIVGPIDLYAGPSLQFLINSSFENVNGDFQQYLNFLAGQAGIKFNFRKFEIDLRYDFTVANDDSQTININNTMYNAFFDDGRLNNVMVGIGFKIFDTQQYRVHSSGNCYF